MEKIDVERFQREKVEWDIYTSRNLEGQYVNFTLKKITDNSDNNTNAIKDETLLLSGTDAQNGIIRYPLDLATTLLDGKILQPTEYKYMIQLTDAMNSSSLVLVYGILKIVDNYKKV